MVLPQEAVIPSAQRTAVHAYRFDGNDPAKDFEVIPKTLNGISYQLIILSCALLPLPRTIPLSASVVGVLSLICPRLRQESPASGSTSAEVFIMIPDLMSQLMDLPDDILIKALRDHPKIVCSGDTHLIFQAGCLQRVHLFCINIMTQDHGSVSRLPSGIVRKSGTSSFLKEAFQGVFYRYEG
jgi:hypothetical protein